MILATNINKHAIDRKLPVELRKVGIIEAFIKKFNLLGPVSHVTRSEPIDGAWITSDLVPKEVSIFPTKFEVSDHRVILVDLAFGQIIERGVQIRNPSMRRLICKNV